MYVALGLLTDARNDTARASTSRETAAHPSESAEIGSSSNMRGMQQQRDNAMAKSSADSIDSGSEMKMGGFKLRPDAYLQPPAKEVTPVHSWSRKGIPQTVVVPPPPSVPRPRPVPQPPSKPQQPPRPWWPVAPPAAKPLVFLPLPRPPPPPNQSLEKEKGLRTMCTCRMSVMFKCSQVIGCDASNGCNASKGCDVSKGCNAGKRGIKLSLS